MVNKKLTHLKENLECLYETYNKREHVNPDPLIFLYDYPEKRDREITGLLAACFAYGRVEMIVKTVGNILETMKQDPYQYVVNCTENALNIDFKGFRYRFATQAHLTNLILGFQDVLQKYTSLEYCFYEKWSESDGTIIPALTYLTDQIRGKKELGHLLADPNKKSACKRSHLFLRWMVRQDRVDPGGWDRISPSQLIVPLDTHMYKAGNMLGFTKRKSMDLKTAIEITNGFRTIEKDDPVKYDFCLTRFGIHRDLNMKDLNDLVRTPLELGHN